MLEQLLKALADLIAAINANTAARKGDASEPEKKGKKEKTTETGSTAAPGVPEVRAAATAYLEAQKDASAQTKFMSELNAKYGSKRISEAPAEKFPEIIAILNAEVARIKAPPANASDAI